MRRFGIPEPFVAMITKVYSHRCSYAQDCGSKSDQRAQAFGICQGCPLSPFLFTILMTVLMTDARAAMTTNGVQFTDGMLTDLLYAHDTLLIGVKGDFLEE